MQFLDLAGVKRFKQYTDNTFVTTEDFSEIEGVVRDTYTKQEIDDMLADIETGGADLTNYYTKSESDGKYASSSDIPTTLPASDVQSWAKAATKPTYTASEVGAATQSDINQAISDLIGTAPEALNTLGEIADALNDDANLASTLTNNISSKYTKPATGIPKSDLESGVQTSLGKADTAIQNVTFNGTNATVNNGVAAITVTIPSAVTESTVSGWGFTKNSGTVTKVKVGTTEYNPSSGVVILPAYPTSLPASDVSSWAKASSKPTYTASEVGALPNTTVIPDAANNSTITIQKGGTTVDSFTTNASSAKTINIPNELPTYSSSDSGKILRVNSSGQLEWIRPAVIYSGSNPSSVTGNNGDIYLQS